MMHHRDDQTAEREIEPKKKSEEIRIKTSLVKNEKSNRETCHS
jgi:hypothetical protein